MKPLLQGDPGYEETVANYKEKIKNLPAGTKYCSFCGLTQEEANFLHEAADGMCICEECIIDLYKDMMRERAILEYLKKDDDE